MKTTIKLSLAAIAVVALVGCASNKAAQTTGAGSSGQNNGAVTSALTPAQMLQQTLAALPNTVYFAFDKYDLSSDAVAALQQNAAVLLKNPQVNIMLAGNTDPIGSQEYNFHLGMKRAKAVYDYFLQQGIPASQMCMVSYGELKPNPVVDQNAVSAAKGNMGALIAAYAPDRRTVINYNQTCQGASTGMSGS